jgi:beta-aspartyl-peptidase (threonine type)
MTDRGVSLGGSWGRWCVLVHGGAGRVPEDRRERHVEGCRRAARVGGDVLRAGGSALDAVERAVRELEDDPHFNAGTGACLNADGHVELDASIMEGRALRAGAVCALSRFAAPISIARAALEDGRHVLYAAEGAARFARSKGFEPVAEEALVTEAARAALARVREGTGGAVGWAGGTVGAVARDAEGICAAATSTGGMVNKRAGRVGDSPIIGAGTYADDAAGAVSLTGDGEGMIRLCAARSIVDRMRAGSSPEEAASELLRELSGRFGMKGGAIVIDPRGRFGLARTTGTMSWAAVLEKSGGLEATDEVSGI